MAENNSANADDSEWKRVLAAYMCVRAQRLRGELEFEVEIESHMAISKDIEERICANNFAIATVAAESLPRSRMTFQRNERWFEETLPHLAPDDSDEDPISVEKRVAVGLYRLCSTAEDRTIAHLFGIGRSTVNVLFREFCAVVITILEDDWVGMVPPDGMAAHMREFHAVTGFPKAVGALDGCHFPVSPPKESATDYYNYKGW
ncbi:hypothetical protein HPB48_004458 [Haemaphysalis longicornis]|uniref:DDE Tnp4 domain-containing protein n=1 Tax=Haemaphysalis longicornis TaxID=44386 RepID=A0A9J6GYZ3_HAELO|nr:hypothetical protein HPB48_004458 [Haemaphysalis longicornis]